MSVKSTDANFEIPDTFIVDLSLCITSEVSARFYISKLINKLSSAVISISDYDTEAVVGSFTLVEDPSQPRDKDFYLDAVNSYTGANGKITIGSFKDLAYQPVGIFNFSKTATEFEPRTIVPGLKGIDRITFIDAVNGAYSLTGNVTLTSRSNLRFSYPDEVRVMLDAGDNLGLSKECAVTNCVKSINGVIPDPITGDIGLLGINCLRIYSSAAYTLDMEDTCCTPCSGCNELEELTTRLTSLENKFLDLKTNYNSVNSQLTTYLSTINSNCACPA